MSSGEGGVAERLQALRAAAVPLGEVGWRQRVRALGEVGARFLDPADPLRRGAEAELPHAARLSAAQARAVVEGMARDWTAPRLEALVRSEFADPDVLDRWVDDPLAPDGRRLRAWPLAPGAAVHWCAGTVPGVSVTSLIRGLLVGSPVLLKPGAGDRVLPEAFARGLAELGTDDATARALSRAAAVEYWPGGAGGDDEGAALAGAGSVVVYGGAATVADIRRRLPPATPLVEYGHRVSVAVVGPAAPPEAAREFAEAVAAFDQRGCVSPHQAFVVGSAETAERFAEAVAHALEEEERRLPPGPVDPDDASAVHQLRGAAELRAAAGEPVRIWAGPGVGWTVVLDPGVEFRPSGHGRSVHVTPLASPDLLDEGLGPVAPYLQSVGISGYGREEAEALGERLGRLGASRVVSLGGMAYPPAWWIHDGQGALRRLVRWCVLGPA